MVTDCCDSPFLALVVGESRVCKIPRLFSENNTDVLFEHKVRYLFPVRRR